MKMKGNFEKKHVLKMFLILSDQENLWESLMDDYYDEEADMFPSVFDLFGDAFGMTENEVNELSSTPLREIKLTAINNHDKLTEENARLREALTELIQLANHPLTVDALDIIQSTEMDRAKQLLKGDEDE